MKADEVKILIGKFLSGESTLEEEQMLGDFFREATDIPEELSAYKEMFSYFDSGMADGSLLIDEGEGSRQERSRKAARHAKSMLWGMAAAVAAALIIIGAHDMALPGGSDDDGGARNSMLTQDGIVEDTLAARTDSARQDDGKGRAPERRLKKWRFKPAPPEILMAEKEAASASDSISEASARMAESEIRKVEQEQRYIISLMGAMDIINSAEIASVADEVEVY